MDNSVSEQPRDSFTSVWTGIPLHYKQSLVNQTFVFLYHTDWHKKGKIPSMFSGRVSIDSSKPTLLNWTWPHDEDTHSISLIQVKSVDGLLTGASALGKMLRFISYNSAISARQCVSFSTIKEQLFLVFQDQQRCDQWTRALKKLVQWIQNSYVIEKIQNANKSFIITHTESVDMLGIIFDIAEVKSDGDMWKEIKVTFVKENENSQVEYLLYDMSSSNFYDSADEVMGSVYGRLDCLNRQILMGFLFDLSRAEMVKKAIREGVLGLIGNFSFHFSRFSKKKNKRVLQGLKKLDHFGIEEELNKQMKFYLDFDFGDPISDCFSVLYMQKIQITLQTAIDSKRYLKNLRYESLSGGSQQINWNSKAAIQEKLEQQIKSAQIHKKEKTEVISKKWYRNVCECEIF